MLRRDLRTFVFSLVVHRGQYFNLGDEYNEQKLCLIASFNGEIKTSHLSCKSASEPVWNCRFEWRLAAKQLKHLEGTGQGNCKLTVAAQDGRQLGWVVCDLRTARLHAKHPQKPAWWTLSGPYRGRESPQVLLYNCLEEESRNSQEQLFTNTVAQASASEQQRLRAGGPYSSHVNQTLQLSQLQLNSIAHSADQFPNMNEHLVPLTAALGQQLVSDGSQRHFQFTVDMREFQAGRRMQQNLATIVVQVSLPQELSGLILKSNGRLPPGLAPLRTSPPVDIARGSEVMLPGGQASVQFTAGLMTLATLLARDPVMTAEVWHKERLAEDSLLGRAYIPLSPLLQESWVDGRARVFVVRDAADGSETQERVQVGSLHLVMSLEEAAKELTEGATPGTPAPPATLPPQQPAALTVTSIVADAAPSQTRMPPSPASRLRLPTAAAAVGAAQPSQQQLLASEGEPGIPPEPSPQRHMHPAAPNTLRTQEPSSLDDMVVNFSQREPQQTGVSTISFDALLPSPSAGNPAALEFAGSDPAPGSSVSDSALESRRSDTADAAVAAPADPAPATAARHISDDCSAQNEAFKCLEAAPAVFDFKPDNSPPTHHASIQTTQQQVQLQTHAQTSGVPCSPGRPQASIQPKPTTHASLQHLSGVHEGCGAMAATLALAGAPEHAQHAERELPLEVEAAWEVELWKREEQEKWKAEMERKGEERMAALEAEWRRREQERDAEQAALRQQCSAMQAKTQQVLEAVEDREEKVLAAEALLASRRRELEREHAARVAEAETAVRRLQMEFEHKMEMERLKTRDLEQRAEGCRERTAAAEAKVAAAERALQEFKEQQRHTPAALLEQQLGEARAACASAERRAQQAAEVKQKYKEQVVRLAQEVSALQRQLAEVVGVRREQLDAEVARLAAQEAALMSRRGAGEVQEMRQQLGALQEGGAARARSSPHELVLGAGVAGEEVQRLLREREQLLGSGAYSKEDALILQLDERIRRCAAQAGAVG